MKKEVINEEFLTVTGQVACRQPFNGPMEEVAGWGEKLDEQECVGIELTSSNFSPGLSGVAQRECVHEILTEPFLTQEITFGVRTDRINNIFSCHGNDQSLRYLKISGWAVDLHESGKGPT